MLSGCSTIENAREAQRELAPRGDEGRVSEVKPSEISISGMKLQNLVDFAMTNRPSLVSARLAVDEARLALKTIAADAPLVSDTPWNALNASVNAGYSERSAGTTAKDHDFRTHGGASASLSIGLLLWDFGRCDARLKAQSERVLEAELALLDEGYAVFADVSQTYFNFLEKSALLEVSLTNQFEYASHLDRAEGMFEAGEAKRLDVLKARLDLASAKEKTVSASNAVRTAAFDMVRSLGLETGRIPRRDFDNLASGALAKLQRAFPDTAYNSSTAIDFAKTNAPAVRIARSRLRAASADVDYAIAQLYPELNASVSLSWSDPLWVFNWGFSAVQSLFQGFRTTTAVDRSVLAMKNASAYVDDVEQKLASNIAIAVADRDNARETTITARESLAQAKENLEVVRKEFELGAASRVDYADAVSSFVRELGNCVSAFYVGQSSEMKLFRLMGQYPTYEK